MSDELLAGVEASAAVAYPLARTVEQAEHPGAEAANFSVRNEARSDVEAIV